MKKRINWPVYIFLSIASLMVMFPFVWMIMTSFKTTNEIITSQVPTFFPKKFYFEGYAKVINDAPFLKWIFNSLLVTVIVGVFVIFSSSLLGYIFAKFEFRFKKTCFMLIMLTLMIPFEVYMIPEYVIISKFGLINKISALIIPSVVSAFGVFLCKQFCESIPNDFIDSARMDGCTEFGIFNKIIIPEIKPSMSALAIFTFMSTWNSYMWPLIVINDTEKMTAPLALSFFNQQHTAQISLVLAAGVMIMIPVIVVYLVFQKQFIEGISMTGLK